MTQALKTNLVVICLRFIYAVSFSEMLKYCDLKFVFNFDSMRGHILFFLCSRSLGLTMEKEMATHSSVLAWRIPGTEEPSELLSTGHTELDTTEAT